MQILVLFIGAVITLFGLGMATAGLIVSGLITLGFGLMIVATTLWETRYRNRRQTPPGDGWEPTDECFVDPETGAVLQVWIKRKTGERTYVVKGDGKSV